MIRKKVAILISFDLRTIHWENDIYQRLVKVTQVYQVLRKSKQQVQGLWGRSTPGLFENSMEMSVVSRKWVKVRVIGDFFLKSIRVQVMKGL